MPISFVCAVYDDFYGLWPTLQSIRLHDMRDGDEIVVVDNHPEAMHSLTAQVLSSAQTAAAHNPSLSSALADANDQDEAIAAGGLTNLLNWIVQNWSQIAAIIAQVLTWFGIKA